jgi:hypothetical protein
VFSSLSGAGPCQIVQFASEPIQVLLRRLVTTRAPPRRQEEPSSLGGNHHEDSKDGTRLLNSKAHLCFCRLVL